MGSMLCVWSSDAAAVCCWRVLPAGLIAEIEGKASQPEYAQLLQDCRNIYCTIRQQVGTRHAAWYAKAVLSVANKGPC